MPVRPAGMPPGSGAMPSVRSGATSGRSPAPPSRSFQPLPESHAHGLKPEAGKLRCNATLPGRGGATSRRTPANRPLLAKKRDLHATNPRTVGCFRPKAPRSADAGPSARGITRGGHACGSCSFPPDARLRRRVQQARQRAAAGGRLLRGAGLHRADLLAAVPQVPRRPRARAGAGGRAPRRDARAGHRQPRLPLVGLGLAQGRQREQAHRARADRRRPGRVRRRRAVPVPGRPRPRSGAQHPLRQGRRGLRRGPQQVPVRLRPPRRRRRDRLAALPQPRRQARAEPDLRGEDQADGQRRPQRRRVLHPPAPDPGDRRGGPPQARRDRHGPGLRLRRLPVRGPRLHPRPTRRTSPPPASARWRSGPSTARRRRAWRT